MPSDLSPFALDDAALHRQLVNRATHRLTRDRLIREGHLKQDPARLDVRHPTLRRALAGTHPGLGRLLGDCLVREHSDPDLAATTDVPGHGDTGRLDLPVGQVCRLQRLDAELAERHPGSALRRTVPVRVVRLAEALRGLTRHQHWSALLLLDRRDRTGTSCHVDLVGTGRSCRRDRLDRGAAGLGTTGGRSGGAGTQPARPLGPLGTLPARAGGTRLGRRLPTRYGVALIDPDLHADAPEGGTRLEEPVLDVGAQRVQRYPALPVELAAGHLGAAQAPGALHPDALDDRVLHGRLHRLAHRPTEADPAGQLLGDALRNQLGIRLGALDLKDVELHLLAGELLQLAADPVGLGALAADDDARPGGVDVDPDPVAGALDVHLGDAGALQALGHHPADLDVLADVVLVELVREPAALPVGRDAEAESGGMNFLAHYSDSSVVWGSAAGAAAFLAGAAFFAAAFLAGRATWTASTAIVMWQVRLRIRYARPCARGRKRLSVGPSSTNASLTSSESGSSRSLFSALAIALASTLYTGSLACCGANCSTVSASFAGRPRTRLTTRRALVGDRRTWRAIARAPGSTGASPFVGIAKPLG